MPVVMAMAWCCDKTPSTLESNGIVRFGNTENATTIVLMAMYAMKYVTVTHTAALRTLGTASVSRSVRPGSNEPANTRGSR